jgi:hypothetical protein
VFRDLFQQIEVTRSEVLVALDATASTYLLGQRQSLAGLRGRIHPFRGSKLIVTYPPASLSATPPEKGSLGRSANHHTPIGPPVAIPGMIRPAGFASPTSSHPDSNLGRAIANPLHFN